jgi:sulfur carrier protein
MSADLTSSQSTIILNGQPVPLPSPSTLDVLLGALPLGSVAMVGVAVAVNYEVIPRSQWSQTKLRPGDRVELIRAVQGG